MYHTSLPFSKGQLGVLVYVYVLPRIDLLHCVAALCDDHESHLAVLVDDHARDFWEGAFAAPSRFFRLEFYVVPPVDLWRG